MIYLLATGGSTNAILHLQAIHYEGEYGHLPLSDFDKLSHQVPLVASLYPASEYDMIDFWEAGGVAAVEILVSGTPETVAECEASHTARFLKPML